MMNYKFSSLMLISVSLIISGCETNQSYPPQPQYPSTPHSTYSTGSVQPLSVIGGNQPNSDYHTVLKECNINENKTVEDMENDSESIKCLKEKGILLGEIVKKAYADNNCTFESGAVGNEVAQYPRNNNCKYNN